MDPQIVVDVLVELGQHEEDLALLNAKADRARRRERDRRELLAELEEDEALAAGGRDDADRAYRLHARELRDAEAQLAAKRDRLVGLSDRRQHRALTEEITALERRVEELELAALDDLDEGDVRAAEAASAHDHAARVAASDAPADPADARRAVARGEDHEREIARLVALLPPDVARNVARLRSRGGRAVAWVDEGACTGCFAQMPPQQGLSAGRGRKLVRCSSCGRYVVHRPWH